MKRFTFTFTGTLLIGWLIWVLMPFILPFLILAFLVPIVSAGVLVAFMACVSLYRRWAEYEANWTRPVMVDPVYAYDVSATPTVDYSNEYRANLLRFAIIGNSVGFSAGRLIPRYASRKAWDTYTAYMRHAEALYNYGGQRGLGWGAGWGIGRFSVEVRRGILALPHPIGQPPRVNWIAGQNNTESTTYRQDMVISQ